MKKFFASCLILSLIFTKNIKAEEYDYYQFSAGDCATQNGYFFTEDGMARSLANIDLRLRTAVADKARECQLCVIDLQTCAKSKETELRIQREMFEKQLLIRQQQIDSYRSEKFWDNIKIVGGIVVGVGAGILIGKFLIK